MKAAVEDRLLQLLYGDVNFAAYQLGAQVDKVSTIYGGMLSRISEDSNKVLKVGALPPPSTTTTGDSQGL